MITVPVFQLYVKLNIITHSINISFSIFKVYSIKKEVETELTESTSFLSTLHDL